MNSCRRQTAITPFFFAKVPKLFVIRNFAVKPFISAHHRSFDRAEHYSQSVAHLKEIQDVPLKKEVNVLLAQKFDLGGKKTPDGYWASEKLDGMRAFWDGECLWSRLGNLIRAPNSFTNQLPKGVQLDGELFLGRERFSETIGIVKSHNSERWHEVTFLVFDIISPENLPFEARMQKLQDMYPSNTPLLNEDGTLVPLVIPRGLVHSPLVRSVKKKSTAVKTSPSLESGEGAVVPIPHTRVKNLEHLLDMLKQVKILQGEGLMLRQPESLYQFVRSKTLLKVKTFLDAEAEVINHEPGRGRLEGMTGALVCRMESGKIFYVGSGMNDQDRTNPPKIGSIITYNFFALSEDGIPRFPIFAGERIDMANAKDYVLEK